MNNVENVDVASAGVFVGEAYEAGDMVGTGEIFQSSKGHCANYIIH